MLVLLARGDQWNRTEKNPKAPPTASTSRSTTGKGFSTRPQGMYRWHTRRLWFRHEAHSAQHTPRFLRVQSSPLPTEEPSTSRKGSLNAVTGRAWRALLARCVCVCARAMRGTRSEHGCVCARVMRVTKSDRTVAIFPRACYRIY